MREYGLCLERTLKRERERFRWRHWYQLQAWEESINSFLQSPSPVRHELLIILKYLILTCLELVVFINAFAPAFGEEGKIKFPFS